MKCKNIADVKPFLLGISLAASLTVANHCAALEMPQLARNNGCTDCHAIDKRVVGPAWIDVSRKYKGATKFLQNGKEYPLEEGLIRKVSKGGTGNWGEMGMPPNDSNGSKQAAIKELVQFVLGLSR
jgi:cytochrome c551/c552